MKWIRRNRLNADDWSPIDIPMSEQSERYQVEIDGGSGGTLQTTSSSTELFLSADEIQTAFGVLPNSVSISVAQISASTGAGAPATIELTQ